MSVFDDGGGEAGGGGTHYTQKKKSKEVIEIPYQEASYAAACWESHQRITRYFLARSYIAITKGKEKKNLVALHHLGYLVSW